MKAIEDVPEIVAGVVVAACFKQLLRADGSLLRVFIPEPQRGCCERPRFRAGQLSRPENFDACGDCRNLVEDSEARFDDFIGRETCVPNRDSLECVTVANEHAVGANETVETRMKLVGAAAVVGIDQAKLRCVFTLGRNDIAALEPNQMLLEAAPFVELHLLFNRRDWSPTRVAQSANELSRWNKRVARADTGHRLRS